MTNFVLKIAVNRCLSNFNYQDNGVSLISKKIFIAPSAIYIFVETATKTTKQHVKTNKQNLTDNMQLIICLFFLFFFYLGFCSGTFTNHKTDEQESAIF